MALFLSVTNSGVFVFLVMDTIHFPLGEKSWCRVEPLSFSVYRQFTLYFVFCYAVSGKNSSSEFIHDWEHAGCAA